LNRALMPWLALAAALPLVAAAPPLVGEKAPDFDLSTPEGKSVRFSELVSKGPVVLVVLRGYPGYQCPYCNRQVQDFIQKSQGFADAGAHVVLVYPGPPQDLGARANEFLADKNLPQTSICWWIPAIRSRTCTGSAGTPRKRPLIHRCSLSISRASYFSARSSRSTAVAPRRRKSWTPFQNPSWQNEILSRHLD
jgi:hypothetical protein